MTRRMFGKLRNSIVSWLIAAYTVCAGVRKLKTGWLLLVFLVCCVPVHKSLNYMEPCVRYMYYNYIMDTSNPSEVPNPNGYNDWNDEMKFQYHTQLNAEMQEQYNKAMENSIKLIENNNAIARFANALTSVSGSIRYWVKFTWICICIIAISIVYGFTIVECYKRLNKVMQKELTTLLKKSKVMKFTKKL